MELIQKFYPQITQITQIKNKPDLNLCNLCNLWIAFFRPSVECFQSMSGKAARRYVVQGRVQGVGFRWFVQRRATALGLTGYVRNLDEGHVEVLAVGSPKTLDQLRSELWRGPVGAGVAAVQESEAPVETFRTFEISY